MAEIVTTCPITGREFPTGVETDADSFLALPVVDSRAMCTMCGQSHPWSKQNARLREGGIRA